MRNLKIAVILLLGVLSLCFSCQKDPKLGEFLLTDEMKAQNPYQKGDSLILISNLGDTISCYVNSRYTQMIKYYYDHTMVYYLIEIEYTSITLRNATENGSLSCQMGGEFANNNRWHMYLHFGEENDEFSIYLPLSIEKTPYIDSLYVRNRWIKDVFIQETAWASTMYYSTEFGIVKIDFSDGSYWELEKIEWADEH